MVLLLIGIAIGVLIVVILIIKAVKTSSRDVLGVNIHCQQCGYQTNGLKCPRCKNRTQFDV